MVATTARNGGIGKPAVWLAWLAAIFLALLLATPASHAAARSAPLTERQVSGFAELLLPTGPSAPAEDAALATALATYEQAGQPEAVAPLEAFLAAHPDSPWRVALLTNLGLVHYHYGYFSRAIDAWEQAWQAGGTVNDPAARALVDRALGELARMHARLGHADRLAELFDEVGERAVTGPATEALAGAREGLWQMRNNPGVAYLCGPMALKNLLLARGTPADKTAFLDAYRSPQGGVTLAEVARLADQANLKYRLIKRQPGEPIPIPSIVHWKVTHFAALVGENGDRLHLKDPTFGTDLWISRDALDAEASGYFLVPKDTTAGMPWRRVSLAEAMTPRGMGNPASREAGAVSPEDDTECPKTCDDRSAAPAPGWGLVQYDVHGMQVSLNLRDSPVGYRPPRGPSAEVTFTYNQREADQPATFGYFNVGAKWTLNWLSYIQDDPAVPGASVLRYVAGGSAVRYSGYSAASGAFAREMRNAAQLLRLIDAGGAVSYERRLADGSVEVYAKSSGATAYPRRLFLSQVIDPTGNAVVLTYDSQLRLTTLTDASGRTTTFAYELPAKPLLLTRVTDPFGRSAQLTYDASGRLNSITDVLGLTSSFTYDGGSFITAMTTPYGTTQFVSVESGMYRDLRITDPLGATEAVVYSEPTPSVPFSEAVVPSGLTASVFNAYISSRNTAYWSKHAYALAQLGGTSLDFTKARIKHWTHGANAGPDRIRTGHTLESIKQSLERRVWFSYPGQELNPGAQTALPGTLDQPSAIARVLDDGSTQLQRYDYNAWGQVTRAVDPVGRETRYTYAANGIDLTRVAQVTPGGEQTLAEITWNNQHRPLTVRDAAGQLTTYTYNAAGQLLTRTNPLGEVTAYEYDALGQLTREVNPAGRTAWAYTYDGFGRVASRTDSEGHTVTFAYDALDRPTRVTYPDGSAETTTYDKLDVASRTDRLGRTTTYAYDAVRNLTEMTDPAGRTTRYGYYADGILKTLTDPNGNVTTFERDIQGRTTARVYADASRETYAYEPATSRLKSRTDPLGQRTDYAYARDDRVSAVDYVGALEPTPPVRFAYDPAFPRLTQRTDGDGATAYTYHPAGSPGALQVAQEDGPFANDTLAFTYDALGRVQTRTVDAVADTYAYDVLGRLVGHATPLAEFAYDYLGATDQRTRRSVVGNAVAACPGSVRNEHAAEHNTCTGIGHAYGIQRRTAATLVTTWQYADNLHDRRLTGIAHLAGGAPAGTQPRSYAYVTDAENRLLNQTESVAGTTTRSWAYSYDPADRLTQALASPGGTYAYTLDPADNLLGQQTPTGTTSSTVNALNQIVQRSGQPLTHDDAGNLTGDGTRTYAWDAEQRLVRIGYTGTGRSTTFRYDGLGRRTAVIENDGATATETRYLWCGERLCQARDATDTVTRRYYDEGELAVAATGDVAAFYAEDHLGSIRDLRLGDGQVLASYDYDPYGTPPAATRPAASTPTTATPGWSTTPKAACTRPTTGRTVPKPGAGSVGIRSLRWVGLIFMRTLKIAPSILPIS